MASRGKQIAERLSAPPPAPMAQPFLSDELLMEIFLRLPTASALVRASTASTTFRRIITDPSFLRLFRTLHPPPLLGFVTASGFHPAEPPHPSAPAARALARAADFSFAFLPNPTPRGWVGNWFPVDVRDGRVLVECVPYGGVVFSELAVCDPLSRRYVLLPRIPDHLAAYVRRERLKGYERRFEAFLAPCGEEEQAEETSFRVVWTTHCKTKLVAFVFSSSTGQWRGITSPSWSDLSINVSNIDGLVTRSMLIGRHYTNGCFYWVMMNTMGKLLVLDARRTEFSTIDVEPDDSWRQIAIVETGEDRLGKFAMRRLAPTTSEFELYYASSRDNVEGPNRWKQEAMTTLPLQYNYHIIDKTKGFLLLMRSRRLEQLLFFSRGLLNLECLSVEVNTLQLERVCKIRSQPQDVLPYTGFPPSFSPCSI